MKVFDDVLACVREMSGLVRASIVGIPGGQVLAAVPDADPGTAIVAGAATDLIRVVDGMGLLLAGDEAVEDVVVTLSGTYHVLRPLPGAPGEGALLVVTLDRERTNLALARRRLHDLGARLVA